MLDISNPDILRDLSWRLQSYNEINDLPHVSWLPLKLVIIAEAYHSDTITQSFLNEHYKFCVSTISRAMKGLKKDGYITFTKSVPKCVVLTEQGRRFAAYVFNEQT